MYNSTFKNKIQKPMKRSGFKNRGSGFKRKEFSAILSKEEIFGINKHLKYSSFTKKPATPQKILDGIISETVRRVWSNEHGFVSCATCGIVKHYKFMDCGHFQDRRHLATRYLIVNLAVQCRECNRLKDGMHKVFAEFIAHEYSPEIPDILKALAKTVEKDFNYTNEIAKWRLILEWVKNNPRTPLKEKLKIILDWK